MIHNQWYVVLDSREVKKGRPVGVTRMGEKMVFWRDSHGKVVCMSDQCPHLGASLCQGKVNGDQLACPFHGFEFDGSGQCVYLPAYGRKGVIPRALKARSYATHEAHDHIWIYWGEQTEGLEPPKFFDTIGADFSYGRFQKVWPVHYSRMVENQLDVTHLPFVHYNTIGAGGRTVVNGPLVRFEGNMLNLWVYNRRDDGTLPLRAEELPEPDRHPFLQFIYPNLWHNWISDDLRITAAFVPIDEENGMFYGRYYQRTVKIPVLRELFNLTGVWGSIYIANQDWRIVRNQRPKKTSLKKMGEKIMQSDGAILAYRKRRQELKEAAGQDD
jgi:phenylpropionate dioxygenase-like ring-hydroxylating dioxygenase large terminal subunit